MNTALGVIGALGGITAFLAAVWTVVKSIAKQVQATKENTEALNNLASKVDQLDGRVDSQGERIATLEGWRRNGAKS